MEKTIVIFFILAEKMPTYFFYKPYRTTFYYLQKIKYSWKLNIFGLFKHSDVFVLSILKFQNNRQALKKLFLFKKSIFLSNINLDRTTFYLFNTLFHHIYPLVAESKAQISQYLCSICMKY